MRQGEVSVNQNQAQLHFYQRQLMKPGLLPPEFVERLHKIVPDDRFDGVLNSFSCEKTTSFRVNTLHAEPSAVVKQLVDAGTDVSPVGWCDHAFFVPAGHRQQLTHSSAATDGQIYIQGLSSILATLILAPEPGQWNLDMAAAPGGKSTHIAALMENQGKLSVVEPIRKRMYRLADNMKRMGVTIAKTYLMDGRKVGQKVPDRFDRILLDAPCSSESRIRADDPRSIEFWSDRKIREQSRKQAGLILSAFTALKAGGTMLYCTCSFAPEENEAIVTRLINEVGDEAELLPIDMPFDNWQPGLRQYGDLVFPESVLQTRRILPNDSFDGFFLAKIRKAGV